jgi:hypothetical protein
MYSITFEACTFQHHNSEEKECWVVDDSKASKLSMGRLEISPTNAKYSPVNA